jgi:hypothetical protein
VLGPTCRHITLGVGTSPLLPSLTPRTGGSAVQCSAVQCSAPLPSCPPSLPALEGGETLDSAITSIAVVWHLGQEPTAFSYDVRSKFLHKLAFTGGRGGFSILAVANIFPVHGTLGENRNTKPSIMSNDQFPICFYICCCISLNFRSTFSIMYSEYDIFGHYVIRIICPDGALYNRWGNTLVRLG